MKTSTASGCLRLIACAALHVDVEDGDAAVRARASSTTDWGCRRSGRGPRPTRRTRRARSSAGRSASRRSGSRCRPLLSRGCAGGVADREDGARELSEQPAGEGGLPRARGSGEDEQAARELAAVGSLIRRSEPVRGCAPARPSATTMRVGDLRVLALGAGGVHLAVHLLDEEVHLAAGGLGRGDQRAELLEVGGEPGHLLGDVGALGEEGDLLGEPLGVDRDALGSSAIRSASRCRCSSTARGASAVDLLGGGDQREPAGDDGRRSPSLDCRIASPEPLERLLQGASRGRGGLDVDPRSSSRSTPGCRDEVPQADSSGSAERLRQSRGRRAVLAGERDVHHGDGAGWPTAGASNQDLDRAAGEPVLHRLGDAALERGELARAAGPSPRRTCG